MAILPDIDQDKVAETIKGWWEDWTSARRREQEKWDECVQNYLVEIDESKYENYPWRSKVADTFSQETGDVIASELRNTLFPLNEKYMKVAGLDEFSRPNAPRMQEHQERMHVAGDLIHAVMPWLKQLSVIGNSPFLLRWGKLRPTIKKRRQVITPANRREIRIQSVALGMRKGLHFDTLDAYDVVMDPKATRQDRTPIIWRIEVTGEQLERMPNMENLDQLDEENTKRPEGEGQELKRERQRIYGLEDQLEEGDFEVLLAYGDLVIDGRMYENSVAAVINRQVTARFETQPFWAGRNIGWGGYDPMWLSVYAKGPLDSVRGLQQLINTFQNQKVDILNLIIDPMFKYVTDGVLDPDMLIARPGGGVEVGTIDNLQPISWNQNVALTYTEIGELRAQGERSTGKSRFAKGQAPGGRRTAFEANLIRSGEGGRSNDTVRYIANSVMEYIVNFGILTTQQMKWEPEDRDGLNEETLLGDYYAQFTGANVSIIRQMELQSQLLLFQIIAQSPEVSAAFNIPELAGALARNLALDNPAILNDQQTFERRLEQLARRAPGRAAPGEEGVVGGADQGLQSLVESLG